ncbi:MAG: hypothetical protein ACR2QW_15115 [bacterium]
MYLEGPLIWLLQDPPFSDVRRWFALHLQKIYEALFITLPTGAIIGFFVRGKPWVVAILSVLIYLVAYTVWVLFEGGNIADALVSFVVPGHYEIIVLFGVSVLLFQIWRVNRSKVA